MSSQVDVSVDALERLKAALQTFDAKAGETLWSVGYEIQRVEAWLEEQKRLVKHKLVRYEKAQEDANIALQRCYKTRKRESDCAEYEQRYKATLRAAEQTREELGKIWKFEAQVKQAIADYQRQAARLSTLLQSTISPASDKLARKISALHNYSSTSTSHSSSVHTTSARSSTNQPESNNTGNDEGYGEYGYQNVQLDQIDLRDSHVHSTDDFSKVSYDEMQEGLRKLNEVVRPAVEQGSGPEYFSQLDEQMGLNYSSGYRNIYDAFYGNQSPIKLVQSGNGYVVDNGYHRLFAAKQMGIESLPAKIKRGF
jgi:hypothetical protein